MIRRLLCRLGLHRWPVTVPGGLLIACETCGTDELHST